MSPLNCVADEALLMLKPDALVRKVEPEIIEACATAGLTVTERRTTRIDYELFLAMHADEAFLQRPLSAAFNYTYLRRSPVEAWRVHGTGAVGRTLTVKSLVRRRLGESDLANVIHAPDSETENAHQLRVFFDQDVRESVNVPTDFLSRFETFCDALDRGHAGGFSPPTIGEDQCMVTARDDNRLDADSTMRALLRSVPQLGEARAVELVYLLKADPTVAIFGGTLAQAAEVAYALDRDGLYVGLTAPEWITALDQLVVDSDGPSPWTKVHS